MDKEQEVLSHGFDVQQYVGSVSGHDGAWLVSTVTTDDWCHNADNGNIQMETRDCPFVLESFDDRHSENFSNGKL